MVRRAATTTLLAMLAIGSSMSDVTAQSYMPVVVTATGPNPVFVELAAGIVAPCDSSSNRQLARTRITPGQTLLLRSPHACVCWRQTYTDSPDTEWSLSRIDCKTGSVCRGRVCLPDPDPVLRIHLQ